MVRRDVRRVKNRRHRELKRFVEAADPEGFDREELERLQRLADEAWERAKREAIETAMGL